MKVKLVRIGNSRGVRIPKSVLEQCGLRQAADLRIEKNRLILVSEHRPRQGWEEAFIAAGPSSNDEQLLENLPGSAFDHEDWRW